MRSRRGPLTFTMPCPFYHYDEQTDQETECEKEITVRWEPPQYPYGPYWEAEGCKHVEGDVTPEVEGAVEGAIVDEIQRREDDDESLRYYARAGSWG